MSQRLRRGYLAVLKGLRDGFDREMQSPKVQSVVHSLDAVQLKLKSGSGAEAVSLEMRQQASRLALLSKSLLRASVNMSAEGAARITRRQAANILAATIRELDGH